MTSFRTPGPLGAQPSSVLPNDTGATNARTLFAAGTVGAPASAGTTASTKRKSGKYWVTWANSNAKRSTDVADLSDPFKTNVKAFIAALKAAGAKVKVNTTTRSKKRAYLFHWSWKISLGKCLASAATEMPGVDIEWDHGDAEKSKAGAQEMVSGFGLAVPPRSKVAPSLNSNHIRGNAIDMTITWTGKIKIKKKDGTKVEVAHMKDANANTSLHTVGESYSVKKNTKDAPHWSTTGR